jgi:L-fucose mutarotase/ribose pyranase (RbsD/FucU family)
MSAKWEDVLQDRLPLYGHRNWIVIADSAYPAQSSEGVETIVSDGEQTAVLARTFALLGESRHIKPTIYTDQELNFVSEADARGVTAYRRQLEQLLQGQNVRVLRHEEILSRLDRVGQMFRVLLIKTSMCIPYTSVFLELECGYWNAEAEKRLRAAMRTRDRKRKVAKHETRR